MPVEDHEVHHSVKRQDDAQYGLCDQPTKDGYYALNRVYHQDGTFHYEQQFIPHVMSTDCRYDKRANDPKCSECSRESDTEYLNRMGL